MKHVFLTSCEGYINEYLIKYMLRHDWYVLALGANRNLQNEENLEMYDLSPNNNKNEIKRLIEDFDCDIFIHNMFTYGGDLSDMVDEVDLKVSKQLDSWIFDFVETLGIKRTALFSTTFLYPGTKRRTFINENNNITIYNNYTSLKISSECALQKAAYNDKQSSLTIFRIAPLYGEGYYDQILPFVYDNKEKHYFMYGSGKNILPACHLDNFCEAIYCFVQTDEINRLKHRKKDISIINVCDLKSPSVKEMIVYLRENFKDGFVTPRSAIGANMKKTKNKIWGTTVDKRYIFVEDGTYVTTNHFFDGSKVGALAPMKRDIPNRIGKK